AELTPAAVALGELMFADPRLSATGTLACASCHDPKAGFAGGLRQDTAGGKPNLRRAPGLVNLAYATAFGWDGRYDELNDHLLAHVRGQLGDELDVAVARLGALPEYRAHFARVGGTPREATLLGLAAYSLTRYAGNAPWDRLERSPDVPADIRAGYQLFSGKAQCSVCHPPPLYTDQGYHRLGLIATPDEGRGRIDPTKQGAFKTPTLRGAAHRTGFFHDGSARTLDDAIDWHLAGGVGQGADPSIIDPALVKVTLTPEQRAQLGAFVRALTDASGSSGLPPRP
ncbi:MAG: cytochrome-c peroxidase, partial [Myxococcota bacterium]|nr:cytochrome-c peroxidase [Myxococcota bacterium]